MHGIKRLVMVTAAAGACAAGAGGLQALAQVISVSRCDANTQGCDPTPIVSIATAGEPTDGSLLSASVGGNSETEPACWEPQERCSPGGTGYAAVSTTGSATGGALAVSGTGSAAAETVGVSGTGNSAGMVTFSLTGQSNGTMAAISGTGPACNNPRGGTVAFTFSGTGRSCMGGGLVDADGNHDLAVNGNTVLLNTGVDMTAVTPAELTEAPDPAFLAKVEGAASLEPGVGFNLANDATGSSTGQCPSTMSCPPDSEQTNQPLTYQQTGHTCGPASTRLVIWQLTGTDHGEATYTDYEGTTSNGTSVQGVREGLNRDAPSNEKFGIGHPDSPDQLMTWITEDVEKYGSSLVENVDTEYLPFWNGHSAWHFDVIYGYDHYSGGHVDIAEEYDPSFGGGSSPYGHHTGVSLGDVYAAVHNGPSGDIIW